jgi:hypothetical protein
MDDARRVVHRVQRKPTSPSPTSFPLALEARRFES